MSTLSLSRIVYAQSVGTRSLIKYQARLTDANGSGLGLTLDATGTAGQSIWDAFGGSNRYLRIKVDNGEGITPREQILWATRY